MGWAVGGVAGHGAADLVAWGDLRARHPRPAEWPALEPGPVVAPGVVVLALGGAGITLRDLAGLYAALGTDGAAAG